MVADQPTDDVDRTAPVVGRAPSASVTGMVEGRAGVVVVEGELDIASAAQLVNVIDSLSGRVDSVVFDMTGVAFVDLAGLKPIRMLRDRGVRAWIHPASQAVRRLLEVVHLEQLLDDPAPQAAAPGDGAP